MLSIVLYESSKSADMWVCDVNRETEMQFPSLAYTGVGLKSWEVNGTPQNVDPTLQTS